jgi:uncharacterized C2H2 Zn-finger protein
MRYETKFENIVNAQTGELLKCPHCRNLSWLRNLKETHFKCTKCKLIINTKEVKDYGRE